jgi:HK97 family phage major capsid protein
VAYNNLISRTDAGALMPEEISREMIGKAIEQSAVLGLFRRVPVGRAQVRFPVLSALPVAYWVNGDTGLKQSTEVNWSNKYLNIEEIAAIVPIPDNVVADVEVNIWDDVMPLLTEAVGRTLDQAVFFGVNAPGTFPTNVVAAATAAGNNVVEGTAAASGGYMGDIDLAYAKLDADGYVATGIAAATSFRSKLRSARDTTGQRLDAGRINPSLTDVDGLPVRYPMRGLWPTGGGAGTNARAIVGEFDDQFVIGVRQDVTFKVSNEAVIQDNTGQIIYNSFQQDLTFLRVTFRAGWQVANTINNDQPVEGSRYPAAVLEF